MSLNKKIVIIKSQPPSYYGGREKQVVILAQAWQQKGYQVFLFSNCSILSSEFRKRSMDDKKIWFGYDPIGWMKTVLFIILLPSHILFSVFFLLYLRLIKKIKYLYLMSIPEKIILTLGARIMGMKVIWEEFYILPKWKIFNPCKLSWILLSRIAYVVTFSNNSKDFLIKTGFSKNKIYTIYPGIDLADIKNQESLLDNAALQSQPSRKLFKIGTICHLTKRNGLEFMLQALKIIIDIIPDAQLIIIGTGEERFNLNWLVRRLELEKHIWFMGYQEDYLHWLKSFDIFVMPSIKNYSINMAIIEAMAHFCPIVASNIDGINEIVKHNISGVLVEPSNPEMLAQIIINLYCNRQQRREIGQNAHQRVRAVFTIERVMEDFEKILN